MENDVFNDEMLEIIENSNENEIPDILEQSGYFVRFYTVSKNGKGASQIGRRKTPLTEKEIENYIYDRGIRIAGDVYVIIYEQGTNRKVISGRLWVSPKPQGNQSNDYQGLSGFSQQIQPQPQPIHNTVEQVRQLFDLMSLIKKMDNSNNEALINEIKFLRQDMMQNKDKDIEEDDDDNDNSLDNIAKLGQIVKDVSPIIELFTGNGKKDETQKSDNINQPEIHNNDNNKMTIDKSNPIVTADGKKLYPVKKVDIK